MGSKQLQLKFARGPWTTYLIVLGILLAVWVPIHDVSQSLRSPELSPWTTSRQRSFRRVPVVLVVFDELPLPSLLNARGLIDQRLFPNFSRLAHDSVWFRNTSAVAVLSHTAVPALMTGEYQPLHGPRPATYPRNLLTMVGMAYDVRTVEPDPRLCPTRLCRTPETKPTVDNTGLGDFGTSARGQNFRSFLELLHRRREPALYYLHLVAPHSPWSFLPSGRRYQPDRRPAGEVEVRGPGRAWRPNPWLVIQAQQQHLLQVRLVDRLVGALIDRLRREGMYERALVVVTADHGMAFEPGLPKRLPLKKTVGEIVTVPLFVKRPFQGAGKISDRPIELVDLVPTIADILHLANVPRHLDGTSAFSRATIDDAERTVYGIPLSADGHDVYGAIEHKYRRFGHDGGSIDLFEVAPGNTEVLLGRAVATIPVSDRVAATIDLRRKAGGLPPLLEAIVTDVNTSTSPVVAIAVNGEIVAISKSHRTHGVMSFSAMLPPQVRSESWADARIFVVERHGGSEWSLLPVETED